MDCDARPLKRSIVPPYYSEEGKINDLKNGASSSWREAAEEIIDDTVTWSERQRTHTCPEFGRNRCVGHKAKYLSSLITLERTQELVTFLSVSSADLLRCLRAYAILLIPRGLSGVGNERYCPCRSSLRGS